MAPLADRPEQLRVGMANERKDRLTLVASIVAAGHEVIARETLRAGRQRPAD